ncbi:MULTISPECIES: hypothetical protein [unclassified Halomonas]|uniref:hypothetical protein n=1 Tax=unclassified Halomonas TaxID=2609666 RepID=UPI001CF6A7F6|nr:MULTISPECIES: hypothetical protein [unclassified Halomonas]
MNVAKAWFATFFDGSKQLKISAACWWILIVSWLPMAAYAQGLTIINGEKSQHLVLSDVKQQADNTVTLFDPYQGREVEVRGIEFRRFLVEQFGEVPPALHFTTWDDYNVTLGGWEDPNWLMVVEEDGEPLTLRSRGPLRLVERDIGTRDIAKLREFNDWIWMIRSIEAQW